jgi:hypothetical protein
LTASDLDHAAAKAGAPRGFGPRYEMALSLMFAAVDHGSLPRVLQALTESLDRWEAQYRAQAALGLPSEPWRRRVERTRAMLGRISAAAGDRG